MSNPLKYVTSTPTGALRHANLGAGVASIQYDETFTSGLNPSNLTTYYLVYEPVEGAAVRIYAPANSTELIALAKSKGSTATSEAGALCFLSENGYYPANRVLENIVTDDLKLFLDPQSATSYPDATSDYILDLSGEAEDGTLYNGTGFNSDSSTLTFDGVNDYLLTDTNVTITGDQSIETFIKFDTLEGFLQGLISNHDYVNTSNFGINQVRSDKIGISIGYTDGSREYNNKYSTTAVVTGRFYHIVMTFNLSANQCKLYIDGELDSTFNLTKTVKYTSRPMVLGRWDYQYTNYYFDGDIAASKYYSKTLSESEVKQNYLQGPFTANDLVFAVDAGNLRSFEPETTATFSLTGSSGAAAGDGVLTNGVGFNNTANGAWDFDGVDDKITLPNDLGYSATSVSVFAWYKINGTPGNSYHIICGDVNLEMSIHSSATYLRNGIGTTNGRFVSNDGNQTLNDGNYHYYGFTFDGSTKRAYIDGVAVGTQSVTGTLTTSFSARKLGAFSGGYQANGNIASYLVWNKVLTTSEIQQNYNANINRFN